MEEAASRGWPKGWLPNLSLQSPIWTIYTGCQSFSAERLRHERDQLVEAAADNASWIMEGIYGSILKQVFPRITTLIWLDIADTECISNLMLRGQTDGGTPEQFEELLEYTRGYRLRQNHLNSFDGHQWFYERHPKQKFRLSSRSDVTDFLDGIR
ncbi:MULTISPECIES: hypothetical protein [Agrobacterium]|uniref:hypothetical protein n=1 Tax=Agrobacterium TaxID=357 RepID=UPI003B9DFF22